MESAKKKYLFAWVALGVAFPVTIVLIGRYGHGLEAHVPGYVFTPLVPLIFVACALGSVGIPAPVIRALVLFLNAALYAGVGWLCWWIVKRSR
jgi:hypothetical protein